MLKNFFPAILLLFLFLPSAWASEEYMADPADEPADFRGVKWQTRLDKLDDMEELYREEDGSQITCSRHGEVLKFGPIDLASVEYIFVNDKFSMGSIVVKGKKNQDALLAEAKSLFGKETVKVEESSMWRFTNVAIMYSVEPDDQSVLFYKYIGFLNK
jgi:hypothetical protein